MVILKGVRDSSGAKYGWRWPRDTDLGFSLYLVSVRWLHDFFYTNGTKKGHEPRCFSNIAVEVSGCQLTATQVALSHRAQALRHGIPSHLVDFFIHPKRFSVIVTRVPHLSTEVPSH